MRLSGNGCTRPDIQESRRGRVVIFEGPLRIKRSKTTVKKFWKCSFKGTTTISVYTKQFRAVKVQTVLFWVMTPCSLVGSYQNIRGNCATIFRVEVAAKVKITAVHVGITLHQELVRI